MNFYKSWIENRFVNKGMKARIVNSAQISNSASIFENIVIERLGDGSY